MSMKTLNEILTWLLVVGLLLMVMVFGEALAPGPPYPTS